MHGAYYGRVWGFGPQFEAEVARDLGDFIGRYDNGCDGLWLAWQGERIVGSVTLDHACALGEAGARVRWFVVEPGLHGSGTGRRLFEKLLQFAEITGQRFLYLWTFEGLTAARKLYDRAGFVVTEAAFDEKWGPAIRAQRMEWRPSGQ